MSRQLGPKICPLQGVHASCHDLCDALPYEHGPMATSGVRPKWREMGRGGAQQPKYCKARPQLPQALRHHWRIWPQQHQKVRIVGVSSTQSTFWTLALPRAPQKVQGFDGSQKVESDTSQISYEKADVLCQIRFSYGVVPNTIRQKIFENKTRKMKLEFKTRKMKIDFLFFKIVNSVRGFY